MAVFAPRPGLGDRHRVAGRVGINIVCFRPAAGWQSRGVVLRLAREMTGALTRASRKPRLVEAAGRRGRRGGPRRPRAPPFHEPPESPDPAHLLGSTVIASSLYDVYQSMHHSIHVAQYIEQTQSGSVPCLATGWVPACCAGTVCWANRWNQPSASSKS